MIDLTNVYLEDGIVKLSEVCWSELDSLKFTIPVEFLETKMIEEDDKRKSISEVVTKYSDFNFSFMFRIDSLFYQYYFLISSKVTKLLKSWYIDEIDEFSVSFNKALSLIEKDILNKLEVKYQTLKEQELVKIKEQLDELKGQNKQLEENKCNFIKEIEKRKQKNLIKIINLERELRNETE